MFFSLIQADGYNPLQVKGSTFQVPEERAAELASLLEHAVGSHRRELSAIAAKPFTPGQIIHYVCDHEIMLNVSEEEFLDKLLGLSAQNIEASIGEGYWIDHWTYNMDLVDSYRDKMEEQYGDRQAGSCLLNGKPARVEPAAGGRFDRTGWIACVRLKGRRRHEFGVPESFAPGRGTGGSGLCAEFGINGPNGYDEAGVGEDFPKIGVGLLTRQGVRDYSFFEDYPVVSYQVVTEPGIDRIKFTVLPVRLSGVRLPIDQEHCSARCPASYRIYAGEYGEPDAGARLIRA